MPLHSALMITLIASCLSASACAGRGPVSDPHDLLGTFPTPERGWRVEPSHVGEWIAVPARGLITVIDFWSTSCEPCMKAMPDLERIWQRHRGAGLQVVGVAIDEEPAEIQRMLPSLGVTFPMLIDSAQVLSGPYRVGSRVPATFVLDRQGRVRFFSGGEGDIDQVADAVRALVAE